MLAAPRLQNKAAAVVKADNPDEVIAFRFFDGTRDELEALRPDPDAEEARASAMAPFIENQFADGLYEVVEVLGD